MKRNPVISRQALTSMGINMFSDSDLEQIHMASVEILERTGIEVESDEARKAFEAAGADVKGKNVRIPEFLINEAIKASPSHVMLAGREEKHDMLLQKGRVYFSPVGQPCYVTDLETGEYRLSTLEDLAQTVRLVDALDQYDTNGAMVAACDVPAETMDFHIFATEIANTSKFGIDVSANTKDRMEVFVELGCAVAGSLEALRERPFFFIGGCNISPLYMPHEKTDGIMFGAENKLPVLNASMVMSGGTGPITLAGSLALHNAEVLSGLVLSQITRPGTPFIYAGSCGMLQTKNAAPCTGSPEAALLNAGAVKMAHFYSLPNNVAGT